MIYALMRAVAGLALRWFYRSIDVAGVERIPARRPLLLVVNHPNALVDALIVAWIVPRRVLITAKATIFEHPLANSLLRWVGVVPLRRASDERASGAPGLDAARNRSTFRAVQAALQRAGTVLIFPEGRSTDAPSLGPLKTGAARMALMARESGDVPGLAIVPIGLTFERKQSPRTRVFAQVGEPIVVDDWRPTAGVADADALTAEIETRLRALTLNYATIDDAARAVRLASAVAAVLDGPPSIGSGERRLGVEAAIAKRVDVLTARLPDASPSGTRASGASRRTTRRVAARGVGARPPHRRRRHRGRRPVRRAFRRARRLDSSSRRAGRDVGRHQPLVAVLGCALDRGPTRWRQRRPSDARGGGRQRVRVDHVRRPDAARRSRVGLACSAVVSREPPDCRGHQLLDSRASVARAPAREGVSGLSARARATRSADERPRPRCASDVLTLDRELGGIDGPSDALSAPA